MNIIDVQRDLALEAAISVIESLAPKVFIDGDGGYFDVSAVEESEKPDIEKAVFYLSSLQRLSRHPDSETFVKVLSASTI